MNELVQKINFVVLLFRIIAWPLVALCVPSAAVMVLGVGALAVTDPSTLTPDLLAVTAIGVPMAYLPVSILRTAKRLKQGDPAASTPALVISGIILLFCLPVGVFLIVRLQGVYEPYCRYLEGPDLQGWWSRANTQAA